jgi:Xaa-Pro aminopeptidase
VVLPHLEQLIKSAVVDPRQFKSESEYVFAQKTAWAYGQAFTDLLNWIDSKVTEAQFLTEKEQGKIPNPMEEMR